jgi:hypothetical protein
MGGGGFTMKPLADSYGYRGIEFGVFELNPGDWQWVFYPKVGCGVKTLGSVKGNLSAAVAACKAAIDAWLAPVIWKPGRESQFRKFADCPPH